MVTKAAYPSTMNTMTEDEVAAADEAPTGEAGGDLNKDVAVAVATDAVVDKEEPPLDKLTAMIRLVKVRMRHSFF